LRQHRAGSFQGSQLIGVAQWVELSGRTPWTPYRNLKRTYVEVPLLVPQAPVHSPSANSQQYCLHSHPYLLATNHHDSLIIPHTLPPRAVHLPNNTLLFQLPHLLPPLHPTNRHSNPNRTRLPHPHRHHKPLHTLLPAPRLPWPRLRVFFYRAQIAGAP